LQKEIDYVGLFLPFKETHKMKKSLAIFSLLSILVACGSEVDADLLVDNFNRQALLENWADNIIIPAYENLNTKIAVLKTASNTFTTSPDEPNLNNLRAAWLGAYMAWQSVDMFEIGKAEEITFRNYMNVYPLDADGMQESLLAGNYDLTSVNRQDEQGFSALDFLLHGLANTDASLVAFYTGPTNGDKYKTYLTDLVGRMQALSNSVLDDWKNGYRDSFVSRNGSSGTESVNSLINDYMFYYEKFLRAGKIGIPAGVFSGSPLSDKVEARYRAGVSKALFIQALDASQNFFNGVHFDGQGNGIGIKEYLDDLNTMKEAENLSALINAQFDLSRTNANSLTDNLANQIETNNMLMLQTFDELQRNVVLMKVDMLQALNVKIDYVDADGD
jgi:hypothetical protein